MPIVAHDTSAAEVRVPAAAPLEALATLPSGRAIHADVAPTGERVLVTAPDGRLEVAIRFTDQGPVLELSALGIHLSAQTVSVTCDELQTRVAGNASIEVAGNLDETVAGRRRSVSQGPTVLAGRDLDLAAEAGELRATAPEDLSIQGRNVLINC